MNLHENAEKVLKSNTEILFNHLKEAISNYISSGHAMGEYQFINAYLSATLNAIMAYIDRLLSTGQLEETEIIQALKYANNLQKHNPQLIKMAKSIGGFSFPICCENEIEIPEINIVLDDCIGLKTRKESQKNSYEKYLQQRPVIETLTPIVDMLLDK